MLRLVLVLGLALTACYRPGSDVPCTVECGADRSCPGELTCDTATNRCALAKGSCSAADASGDGAVSDAPADARVVDQVDGPIPPPALCVPSTSFGVTTFVTSGIWFTPDLDRIPQLAAKYDGGEVQVTENDVNSTNYASILGVQADITNSNPRLAPSNDELYYLRNDINNGAYSLQRAKRNAVNNWTSSLVLLKDEGGMVTIPITGVEEIGAPTTTSPRRMLVTTGSLIDEFEQVTMNSWRRVRRHAGNFGTVVFLGRATLSESGRRMVFRGHLQPQNVAGYYVDRGSIADPFPMTATKIPGPTADSVETPYLGETCRDYYYSSTTSSAVVHIAYQ